VQRDPKLIVMSQRADYSAQSWGKCLKPCYTNLESPVVSQRESECMTNCMAKALETAEQFHRAYMKL
jgi:hypothetical protein